MFPSIIMVSICSCCIVTSTANWGVIDIYYKEVVPLSVEVFEKSSVTLYCGSSSPVQWMYMPSYCSTYQSILQHHLKGSKQITLQNLKTVDSGLYYCNGTYEGGTFSSFVDLIVHKGFVPKGRIVPDRVEIAAGGNVTLTCSSNDKVEWFSEHIAHQDKIIGYNYLELFNLQKEHSGLYFCRGTHYQYNELWDLDFMPHLFHSSASIIVDSTINRIKAVRNH